MAKRPFEVGDWLSDFTLQTTDGQAVSLSDTVGMPVALLFLGPDPSANADAIAGFAARADAFAKQNAAVRVIQRAGDAQRYDGGPFPVLQDVENQLHALYQMSVLGVALNNLNARLHQRFFGAPHALANQTLSVVETIRTIEAPRVMVQQAPILLIPDVLPKSFCEELMNVWQTEGNQESGFMKDVGSQTVGVFDPSTKIRRDHFIPNTSERHVRVREILARHTITEINKAFNFEVTRMEDMKIACYDASRGGYFRAHRDNTTAGTAHRKFAASILLNDDYEGGYLRFPEYGPHLYRPGAGGAAVFGCSLLHEATDVTAGRRFVLLTFFYGEKEARIREEYAKRSGTNYRAS